jgi:serine/threonine-protein kinase
LPHLIEPAGTVTAQSPLPGQRLHAGASVQVAISTGRPQLPVPDLIGLPYTVAAPLAEGFGFTINRREEPDDGATGVVLRIEPRQGTMRELPATITMVVSIAREPDPAEFEAPLVGAPRTGGWDHDAATDPDLSTPERDTEPTAGETGHQTGYRVPGTRP